MAKKLNKSGKCDFVIIDYLQLADMEGGRTRENEVSESCRVAKKYSKNTKYTCSSFSSIKPIHRSKKRQEAYAF